MWRVSTGAFVNRDVLTVIHAGDSDGNGKTVGDPFFVPFIGAPCFPSYPSNHGSAAGGGVEVLKAPVWRGGALDTHHQSLAGRLGHAVHPFRADK